LYDARVTTACAMQITAEREYATLCTFLETLLTHVWCAGCLFPSAFRKWLAPVALGKVHRVSTRHRLVMHRYPTSVATLSRRARDIIEAGFERSVDEVCALCHFVLALALPASGSQQGRRR
jgi:hypothetical protein